MTASDRYAEYDPGKAYSEYITAYRDFARAADTAPADLVLATVATSRFPGVRLWSLLVAPASSGKTDLLLPFKVLREKPFELVHLSSSVTPNALVSGAREDSKADLLPKLNGKTQVILDLSPILSLYGEARAKVVGDYRAAFDGTFSKESGMVGHKEYDSEFNLIAAVTGAVERYHSVLEPLGPRFVFCRMRAPKDPLSEQKRDSKTGHRILGEKILEVFRSIPENEPLPPVPEPSEKELWTLAAEVGACRADVPRESYSHDILDRPEIEGPMRLTNQLMLAVRGLALVRHHSEVMDEDMELARRLARDTIPAVRREFLECVRDGESLASAIAQRTGYSERTADYKLEDLRLLGLLRREGGEHFLAHPLRILESKPPLVTPGSQPVSAADLYAPDGLPLLHHVPGNETDPKLKGANLKRLSDEVTWRVRVHPAEPISWLRRDVALALQLPEDPETNALVDAFIDSMRRGLMG